MKDGGPLIKRVLLLEPSLRPPLDWIFACRMTARVPEHPVASAPRGSPRNPHLPSPRAAALWNDKGDSSGKLTVAHEDTSQQL